jgi:uncharacterized protein (DUF885 family)
MDASMIKRSLVLFLMAFVCATPSQDLATRLKPLIDSKGKVPDTERLRRLFEEDWKYTMEQAPESATENGYPGLNDKWTDQSLEAIARRKQELNEPLKVLRSIDRAQLNSADQLNYDLFERNLKEDIEGSRFPAELMPINQMAGAQQYIAEIISISPFFTTKDYQDVLARLNAVPRLIDQVIALMERGLEQKITPPKITLRDVPQQIRNQIVEDLPSNPLYKPFTNFLPSISVDDQAQLRARAADAIKGKVLPAFRKLDHFFTEKYLPHTRESIGLSALPNGAEWYLFNARRSTTTTLMPRQIHEIGFSEVKRIRQEMDAIILQTGFKGNFAEFAKFLRTDPRFFYTRAEDLVTGYRDISKRVDPELAKIFGKLPRLPYGVTPIPSYAEKSQTTAYYQPGAGAFGRAGYFFCNTYNLPARPKWEMEALTLHEAVPGHHLQISLAQELENFPEFRKHEGYTAFVEGWGLYSESLGTELGFYKDPYSKFGQLTYEMWRAIRLVVDTGMHDLGWSREQAIQYFSENSAKTEHDIVVEIDRYIVWPGQALAYKIGELKIKELRHYAEQQLGEKFDVRKFHDELLGQGALPMDVLEKRMRAWVERVK